MPGESTHTGVSVSSAVTPMTSDAAARRRLYVFSPLPPQRNGLADYIVEYLPMLMKDFDLHLVAESGHSAAARARFSLQPGITVIDEAHFLARQPEPSAQILYNVGNNGDCAYLLDYAHRFPGVVIVHDISLFYLHQVTAQLARANGLMGRWLAIEQHEAPEDFLGRDGSVTRTPGTMYQECLMVRRLVTSAQGLMVHTEYAERRLRGGASGVGIGAEHRRPLARIPHFVLSPPEPAEPAQERAMLARFGVTETDFVMLVPGFLTGNKMLYEVLVAHHAVCQDHPGLKLIFAGEERANEYDVSRRIAQLWPEGNGPTVTGYLEADELDLLLGRADLSFVLRHPTYGESSGILPRAAMGGGDVLTVDIGAYAEFTSPQVTHVPVGAGTVAALEAGIRRSLARHAQGIDRAARRAEEARRAQALTPAALYPRLRQLLQDTQELHA